MAEIEQLRAQVNSLDELLSVYERSAIEQTEQLEATITKLKQTQAKLVQTEKMSSLGLLVAGVAHEINNPISFIAGNIPYLEQYSSDLLELVELYQKCFPEPPSTVAHKLEDIKFDFLANDLPEILKSVHLGTDRIKQIVVSLRNFSRLDEAQWKEVDIHDNLESTLVILRYRLKSSSQIPDRPSINLERTYGKLPLMQCYPGPLNQVFMNLIANAIDAIEERFQKERDRGIPLKEIAPLDLAITTEQVDDDWVRIRVQDSGSGLPKEAKERLFEPLFTTKAVGKGTGLGLSISHQIVVERHGGCISAHSMDGKGAEFIVELPIRLNHNSENLNSDADHQD